MLSLFFYFIFLYFLLFPFTFTMQMPILGLIFSFYNAKLFTWKLNPGLLQTTPPGGTLSLMFYEIYGQQNIMLMELHKHNMMQKLKWQLLKNGKHTSYRALQAYLEAIFTMKNTYILMHICFNQKINKLFIHLYKHNLMQYLQ